MAPPCPNYDGIEIGGVIPGSYIITLKKSTSENGFDAHKQRLRAICDAETARSGTEYGPEPYEFLYSIGEFKGYCGTFTQQIIDELAQQPEIERIEPNTVIGIPKDEATEHPDEQEHRDHDGSGCAAQDYDYDPELEAEPTDDTAPSRMVGARAETVRRPIPSWGLGAISHRAGNGTSFPHHSSAGSGVTIFVLDTGIRVTHEEFAGRASWGATFVPGNMHTDVHGHGTHVAGIAGGANVGVANRANLIAVKVLGNGADGTGTAGGIIAGVQWSVNRAIQGRLSAVLNMSLGLATTLAVDDAVNAAAGAGLMCCVAAGNSGISASGISPARAARAFTVGATRADRTRWPSSNHGPALNIFAPGADITSCGIRSNRERVVMSGTSMAAPHVAGVAATMISTFGRLTPEQLHNAVLFQSSSNILDPRTLGHNSPNLFLYNNSGR